MEVIPVIHVEDFRLASQIVLGLPVLVRTLKVLLQSKVQPVVLIAPEEKKALDSFLQQWNIRVSVISQSPPAGAWMISGAYHYDPAFIRWWMENSHLSFSQAIEKVPVEWWQKLTEPEAVTLSSNKLFFNIRKNTEGWAAYYINKPISFQMTRGLLYTSITPNQITFFNFILALLSAWFLASPLYMYRIMGGLGMALSSIIDGCDGEVARLKVLSSNWGAWFDTVADDVSNNLFLMALFIGLYRDTGYALYWQIGWLNLSLSVLVTALIYHQLISAKKGGDVKNFKPVWDHTQGKKSFFEKVRPLMKRDFFIVVILFFVVIDYRVVVLWMALVGTTVTFILYFTSFIMQVFGKKKNE